MRLKNSTKGLIAISIFILVMIGLAIYVGNMMTRPDRIEFGELIVLVRDGQVAEINVSSDNATISSYARGVDAYGNPVLTNNGQRVTLRVRVREAELTRIVNGFNAGFDSVTDQEINFTDVGGSVRFINYSVNDRNAGGWMQFIIPLVAIVFVAILAFFLLRNMMKGGGAGGAMNFGKSNKARVDGKLKIRFNDVAGAEEEKEELAEIVEFLKHPAKFTAVGARIPKGVLLVGPPGTGKTLFAKAVSGEADVPFFSISGSDFVEMFVGVGASRVRDLFDQAKKSQPCIVFIDEIDAVGRQRGTGMGGGHDEREQTLNQLLVQMDGFEPNEGIIVMAATNRVDILDPALLRPGRFDRQIYVASPDVRGREAILKVHARNKPIGPDVDFQVVARIISGASGADIENYLNEAAILCARAGRTLINMEDIQEGISKTEMGPAKKSRLVTEVDKRITAYHEAGHAIVANSLKNCDHVHEVTIIPRGPAGGYTLTRPDNDDNYMTYNKISDTLAMSMGGRAAEEIVIGDISTGASGDIKQSTSWARKMVTEWGMSPLGPVFYGSSGEVFLGRDYGSTQGHSESIAAKIDAEVAKIINKAHKTARDILENKKEIMENMVRLLIERETIYREDVELLLKGESCESVKNKMDERLNKKYGKSGVIDF